MQLVHYSSWLQDPRDTSFQSTAGMLSSSMAARLSCATQAAPCKPTPHEVAVGAEEGEMAVGTPDAEEALPAGQASIAWEASSYHAQVCLLTAMTAAI